LGHPASQVPEAQSAGLQTSMNTPDGSGSPFAIRPSDIRFE